MSKAKSWIVRMECTVIKDVVCDGCTKEQAEKNPWEYATSDQEIDMRDWEVKSIEENP